MEHVEESFSCRLDPFINERKSCEIMAVLEEAQTHIEQNVSARMVFFDMALRMIVEMKQR